VPSAVTVGPVTDAGDVGGYLCLDRVPDNGGTVRNAGGEADITRRKAVLKDVSEAYPTAVVTAETVRSLSRSSCPVVCLALVLAALIQASPASNADPHSARAILEVSA
jgi:hypothetical protein